MCHGGVTDFTAPWRSWLLSPQVFCLVHNPADSNVRRTGIRFAIHVESCGNSANRMEKWLWWLFLRKESGQSNLEQSRAFLFSYLLFLMLLAHPDPKRELNWIRRHVKSGTKGNLAAAPPCVTTGTHGVRWCPAHLCQGS